MPQLPSWVGTGVSKDFKTHNTTRFLLACIGTLLATVAVAIGNPERSSQNSDSLTVEQRDRPSTLHRNSEMQDRVSPPEPDSAVESDEDCE